MKKIQLKELLANNNYKKIFHGETSQIFLLQNGKILKLFVPMYLSLMKIININLEQKILSSERITLPKEIVKPEIAVYDGINFIGYTMERAKGINYNTRDKNLY